MDPKTILYEIALNELDNSTDSSEELVEYWRSILEALLKAKILPI